MEFLSEYGMFLAKAATLVVAILATVGGVVALTVHRRAAKDQIEINDLNSKYESMANALNAAILPKKEFKQRLKSLKKQHKGEQKQTKSKPRNVFVLNFHGDLRGTAVSALREEITAVLTVAKPDDEVVVKLESPGGMVHSYGLAASQLLRIKERKIPLTVAADKVAASGGYMMACVADRVITAPFAVVGSIGVMSQLPNFNKFLKKHDIDYEHITAGEYKTTLTLFGENTEKGRQKFREDIEDVHRLFKDFVKEHRGQVDIDKVATGEHWHGKRALELQLVDELKTSDDYLMEASKTAKLYEVTYTSKKSLADKLSSLFGGSADSRMHSWFSRYDETSPL
ncbi:MAG: protease SohB [Gammaproteobacteria bacterium]|nr:protease SohB [Gammaproteobacteria bacterium]